MACTTHCPATCNQLAITLEFIDFTLVAWQHARPRYSPDARAAPQSLRRRSACSPQGARIAACRGRGRPHRTSALDVQAEPHGAPCRLRPNTAPTSSYRPPRAPARRRRRWHRRKTCTAVIGITHAGRQDQKWPWCRHSGAWPAISGCDSACRFPGVGLGGHGGPHQAPFHRRTVVPRPAGPAAWPGEAGFAQGGQFTRRPWRPGPACMRMQQNRRIDCRTPANKAITMRASARSTLSDRTPWPPSGSPGPTAGFQGRPRARHGHRSRRQTAAAPGWRAVCPGRVCSTGPQ
jgi:hypothetical protein